MNYEFSRANCQGGIYAVRLMCQRAELPASIPQPLLDNKGALRYLTSSNPLLLKGNEMFGLFSKNRKALEEQKNRATFFFNMCKEELHNYVVSLREKDTPPTIEESTRAAVNGKIFYELFKNVKEFGPEAREIGVSLAGQTIDLMATEYKISSMEAGKVLFKIIDEEIELLQKKEKSDRIFGSVSSAYTMTILVGFDEVISS